MTDEQKQEREANARLIACAPELLAMLGTLCNGLRWNIEQHPTVMNEADSEALTEAEALILKATAT